jgi:hypothetical protein
MTDAIQRVLSMTDLTSAQRLVYLALRDRSPLTCQEIAAHAGIAVQTAHNATDALAAADWVTGETRVTDGRGGHPTEYQPLVPCPECDERFVGEQGVSNHRGHGHDGINAKDLEALDPDDVGEDPSAPAPEGRGLR